MGIWKACETERLLLYGFLDVLFSVLEAEWWSKSAQNGPEGTRSDCRRDRARLRTLRRGSPGSLALYAHAWKELTYCTHDVSSLVDTASYRFIVLLEVKFSYM